MKIISIINLILLVCFKSLSQETKNTKISSIQGMWSYNMNTDSESLYKIIKGNKGLGISLSNEDNAHDFYLNESIQGFQDSVYNEVDSININSFKENGLFFTTIINNEAIDNNGWVEISYCIISTYFECNGDNMAIGGWKLHEYYKIDRLPTLALKRLYDRGKLDKRNYIKEYIGIDVREIKNVNCAVYSEPGKLSKLTLSKNDLVTVIVEKGEWYKVEFEIGENVQQGFIMKKEIQ